MEEATERLVKLFLESKGFVVKTDVKQRVGKNNSLIAIDLLAIREVHKNDCLPDKILAEVKSYSLDPSLIKEIQSKIGFKSRDDSERLKLFNQQELRAKFLAGIEKEYGRGFKFLLFTRGIVKKHEKLIKEFLDKHKFKHISHEEVIKGLVDYSKTHSYSNDSELQLLRLLREFKFIN